MWKTERVFKKGSLILKATMNLGDCIRSCEEINMIVKANCAKITNSISNDIEFNIICTVDPVFVSSKGKVSEVYHLTLTSYFMPYLLTDKEALDISNNHWRKQFLTLLETIMAEFKVKIALLEAGNNITVVTKD